MRLRETAQAVELLSRLRGNLGLPHTPPVRQQHLLVLTLFTKIVVVVAVQEIFITGSDIEVLDPIIVRGGLAQ